MTMVMRQIVGYDPNTERVAVEYSIPVDKWGDVANLVKNNNDDPDYLYNYPLEISLANDIMGLIGERAAQNLKYFLECDAAG